MDCFDLISIPRFMGIESNEEEVKPKTPSNKNDLISKLISESKKRKKLRLSEDLSQQNVDNCHNQLNQVKQHLTTDEISVKNDDKPEDTVEDVVQKLDDSDDNIDQQMSEAEDEEQEEIQEEVSDNFPVIGQVLKVKTQKVTTITEKWLTEPIVFDNDMKKSKSLDQFSHIIDKSMISLLSDNGVNSLFPVQQEVIPYLLKCFNNYEIIRPKDVCVCSPTGSGKTLSFVIPIVQYLRKRIVTEVRVLVVLPVRDLAVQVFQVFQNYCKKSSLKVGLVVGHKSFAEECDSIVRRSIDGSKYHSLVDILVATPGKLVDLIQRADGFDLRHLEILVLDESDRMMSEVQFNWLQEIESSVFTSNRRHHCFCSIERSNSDKQIERYNLMNECLCENSQSLNVRPIHKILFSATLSTDPEKLKFISLFQPILFAVSSDQNKSNDNTIESTEKYLIPKELKEFMIISKEDRKPLIIWYLMEVLKYKKVLCFTGSVENSHRLYSLMKEMSEVVVAEYSSRLNAKKREKLLNHFMSEKIDLIICSDIFARGLDIDGINCVICYDPPRNATQYIHRVGRTARAGNEGTAIMLLTPTQISHFNIISRRVHQKSQMKDKNDLCVQKMTIKESDLKPLMTKYKKSLEKLSVYIKLDEKKKKILKRNFKHL